MMAFVSLGSQVNMGRVFPKKIAQFW